MVPDGARWYKMVQDAERCCEMVQDGGRWCKMVQDDGARWCKIVATCTLVCFSEDTLKENKKPNPVCSWGGPRENISRRRG